MKRIGALLQTFNLTSASTLALSILADAESPLQPNEIADQLIIIRATVTGLLYSFERQAYSRRLPHPSDRRMILVEITDKGRKVANDFRPIVHQHQKQWPEVLGETEQQQLIVALHCLQESLQDAN